MNRELCCEPWGHEDAQFERPTLSVYVRPASCMGSAKGRARRGDEHRKKTGHTRWRPFVFLTASRSPTACVPRKAQPDIPPAACLHVAIPRLAPTIDCAFTCPSSTSELPAGSASEGIARYDVVHRCNYIYLSQPRCPLLQRVGLLPKIMRRTGSRPHGQHGLRSLLLVITLACIGPGALSQTVSTTTTQAAADLASTYAHHTVCCVRVRVRVRACACACR